MHPNPRMSSWRRLIEPQRVLVKKAPGDGSNRASLSGGRIRRTLSGLAHPRARAFRPDAPRMPRAPQRRFATPRAAFGHALAQRVHEINDFCRFPPLRMLNRLARLLL